MDEIQTSPNDGATTRTLTVISEVLARHQVPFWLEAGTALAAYRDGKILPWEHDIDLAIWKTDEAKLLRAIDDFRAMGCRVVVQKDLPLIDNIIQVFMPENFQGSQPRPNQIDFYIYTAHGEYAYMRWLQKPEGFMAEQRRKLFRLFAEWLVPRDDKWSWWRSISPLALRQWMFTVHLKLHVTFSTCIFHRFPLKFFSQVRAVDFHGVKFNIAHDTESYLAYRYGNGWRTPDSQFNQSGKWRQSQARVLLPMNEIPLPPINFSLLHQERSHAPRS